jgi:hypothetical protein
MKTMMLGVLVALALVVAGCGDDDDSGSDGSGSDGVVSSQCTQDQPDCEDTAVDDGDDESGAGQGGGEANDGGAGGMVIDGGLSISEALNGTVTGTIAVGGFVVGDADSVRLCELLAESFPPQCGGASVTLSGISVDDLDGLPDSENLDLQTSQGVTWTDRSVSFFGELVDGEFVIDTLAAG